MGLNFYLCPDEKTVQDIAVCKTILALCRIEYPVQHSVNAVLSCVLYLVYPGSEYAVSEGEGTSGGPFDGPFTSPFF